MRRYSLFWEMDVYYWNEAAAPAVSMIGTYIIGTLQCGSES
jgi:hypothetical protein